MFMLALLFGCPENLNYSVGVGSVYTTHCSAEMKVQGDQYLADCQPPVCDARFADVGVSHVVVALDPGVKVLGYAERTCLQDLEAMLGSAGK